jgi:DNA polymerase-3 subunit alpha
MAALLNSDRDDTDRIAIEIEEARNMGIEVLPPNINESFNDFAVIVDKDSEKDSSQKPKIRFGLEAIKGVGAHISEVIIEERKKNGKYKDLIDLLERVADKDMNKKSLEALAMSGALDGMISRNQVLQNIDTLLSYTKEFQKNMIAGQESLFGAFGQNQIDAPKISLNEVEEVPQKQKLSWEKALLGLYISDHPLREYQDYFSANATPIRKLSNEHVNRMITVGGIVTKLQKVYTRKNQLMYFVVLEDGIGKIECLVFPKIIERTADAWAEEKVLMVKGKLSEKEGELKLLAENVVVVNEKELKKYRKKGTSSSLLEISSKTEISYDNHQNKKKNISICLGDKCGQEILAKISKVICSAPKGECRVYIISQETEGKLETPHHINYNEDVLDEIRNVVGKGNVVVEFE